MENNTAWITSCKTTGDSYLVNGNMSVPNDPANRHCADVLAWIAEGNTPAPEYTDAEIAAYDSQAYARNRAEAYPSLTEQADMAYWDRQNGTTTLDDAITAIKLEYPKG
jgi:hypothetical protein